MKILRRIPREAVIDQDGIAEKLTAAREYLARGQVESGQQMRLILVDLFAAKSFRSHCQEILHECSTRMHEFCINRLAYTILSLTVLEKCVP
jgi:hypothetical protein